MMLVQAKGFQNKQKSTHHKRSKITTGLKNENFYSWKQTIEEVKRQDTEYKKDNQQKTHFRIYFMNQ